MRLWTNECKRTFEDRFINTDDIVTFRKYLQEAYTKCIGEPDEKNNPLVEPCCITSFVASHLGQDQQYTYADVTIVKKVVDEKLVEYNEIKA